MAGSNQKKQKGVQIVTPVGRLSFPNVLEPALKYKSQTEFEYSTEILWDSGTDIKPVRQACAQALNEYFGDKSKWPKNIILPIKDQAEKIEKLEEKGKSIDAYQAGAFWLRAKSSTKMPPSVLAEDGKTVLTKQTGETCIYGGAFARIRINLKVNVVNNICYVTAYLMGVQFVRHGEAFGGGKTAPTDMFDAVADFDDTASADADDLI